MSNMMNKVEIETVKLGLEDGFLTHSTKASGGGFLKNWQKEKGSILVWMHPKMDIISTWFHQWYGVDVDPEEADGDDENPLGDIVPRRFRCFEVEKLLKKQFWREKEDGSRTVPPELCPMDLFIEWVRDRIDANELDMIAPLLKFETGDTEHILYAGGATGVFDFRKEGTLTKEEKRMITKHTGLTGEDAFKQSLYAKQSYLGAVVPHEIDEGDQALIARIGAALGNAIKKVFADKKEELEGKWSYAQKPMAILWKFDDKKDFANKYSVVPKSLEEMPEHVRAAFAEPPPSIDRFVQPYHLGKFRRELEAALQIEAPVADFFAPVEQKFGIDTTVDDSEEESSEEETEERVPNVRGPRKDAEVESEPEAEAEGESEGDEEQPEEGCLACNAPMGPEDLECNECGAQYTLQDVDGQPSIVLVSRPCANPECEVKDVRVEDDGSGECQDCGAVHDKDWNFEMPEKVEEDKPEPAKKKVLPRRTSPAATTVAKKPASTPAKAQVPSKGAKATPPPPPAKRKAQLSSRAKARRGR